MKHDLGDKIITVPLESLHLAATNKGIHADFDPHGRDAWLIDDIRQHGILFPLLVHPNRGIEDGRRRFHCAKYLKETEVRVLVLADTENGAAFSSAQLARTMTLYAKCVLYREKLIDMVRCGEDARGKNLKLRHTLGEPAGAGGTSADDTALNQEWIKCEEALGVSRRYMVRGIKMLETLEAMTASGQPDEIDRATRILSVFRNRGLRAARRMLGENDSPDDEAEPDCIDWHDDNDEARAPAKGNAKVKKFAKKNSPDQSAPWKTEVLKYLGLIETLAKKNKAYSPIVRDSLNAIERDMTGGPAKRVA